MAVIVEGGLLAKNNWPNKLEKQNGYSPFAMKWFTSARVENLLIRKAN